MKCIRCGLISIAGFPSHEPIAIYLQEIFYLGKEIKVCGLCMTEIRQKNAEVFDKDLQGLN